MIGFGWLIKLLAPRLGEKLARIVVVIGVMLVGAFILWRLVDAYGDRRAAAREVEVRAEYQRASDLLREQARQSATRADDDAVVRLERQQALVREEQERIDEAERNGQSTFDVLFGTSD